ncbi:hypothetical protein LJN55_15705 [Erwinia rhapontici]|uniref:Uncharacterized protein n=1 Tax=Erwinia rhapontici TaxID=55212 RepID=A0ABN6DM01_ERWRD|nr:MULTISPECIES: hypothetical protein [Erwinia]MBP2156694.1 hypothetical protein [Erwinia rhapontici]MCS3607688.1 hypothetical protein [Erwinia rhapontici]NNS07507.1 hypothetical protein [Erwinia sp. JH02]TDT01860.1 hypothetical protein EDF84_101587 [Erwinia rhapontici]UDQ78903.1 hypothetical protein LJN55_15705 [Erwinia rhapontici]
MMKGIWLHFTRFFQAPSGMATLDSCRVIEAMMPMVELYGVDLHDLPSLQQRHHDASR